MVKDGWHEINGNEVYVESGRVIRGVVTKGGDRLTAYPYKYDPKYQAYVKGSPSVSAFRNGSWVLK